MVTIRVETAADHAAVRGVVRAAFGAEGGLVADLVEALRASDGFVPRYALVADAGTPQAPDVVGHTMLTWSWLEPEGSLGRQRRPVLTLSPLSVRPDVQRGGVGRALLDAACAAAQADGEPFVQLEGDPAYYRGQGFVAGSLVGLRRPSEHTPDAACQVRLLAAHDPADPAQRGRLQYAEVFWDTGSVGLPMDRPAFLDTLERACRVVEQRVRTEDGAADGAALAQPVPACPGWTVGDVVRHLVVVHAVVTAWVGHGRRPRGRDVPAPPADDAAAVDAFAAGWRALQDTLDARGFTTPTATWSAWDATAGFWFRRMAHEAWVHAADVVEALPHKASLPLRLDVDHALDGVDEVVRLWLGTRLGHDAGGTGDLVRLVAAATPTSAERFWTVGLHGGIAETHDLDVPADAAVAADPRTLYRWVWGRAADDAVTVTGDAAAVAPLRAALTKALQ